MDVYLESAAQMAARQSQGKKQGKQQRPAGNEVPKPHHAARHIKEDLHRLQSVWTKRLLDDPSSFAEVEREVHAQMRHHADVYTASLLALASQQPEMAAHVKQVVDQAEVDLRPGEKKVGP